MTPRPANEPNLTNAQIAPRVNIFNAQTMPTCAKLHGSKMCDVDWRLWARDFYDRDAESDYESQYETEAEARQRLGEDGTDYDSASRTYPPGDPGSSFGPNYPGGY